MKKSSKTQQTLCISAQGLDVFQYELIVPNKYGTTVCLSAVTLRKAFRAVNRLIVLGLERDLGGFSAFCTHRVKHLAGSVHAFVSLLFSCFAASRAARRIVFEIILCVELLLSRGKYELFSAVLADQNSVFKHFEFFPLHLFGHFLSPISADLIFAPTLANWRVRS